MQIIRMRANDFQKITYCLHDMVATFLQINWSLTEIRELCHDNYDSIDEFANKIALDNGFIIKAVSDQDTTYLVFFAESNDNSEIPYAAIVPSNDECYEFVDIDDDIWRSGIVKV